MKQVTFSVDGREITAEQGENLLRVCQREGFFIPSLTNSTELDLAPIDDDLGLVEVDGSLHFQPAGLLQVREGMQVRTDTPALRDYQKGVLTNILGNHFGDCFPPCQMGCPCKVPCSHFLKMTAEGRYLEALKLVREQNPWALVCGTVCPRFCEMACRRHVVDYPVAINDVKRFLAERRLHGDRVACETPEPDTGKKIAVVGAGPAGLGAAHFLRKKGHQVTVFEALPQPGGMLRYGIPEYRLPKAELDLEIDDIATSLGVEIRCEQRWGVDFTVDTLKKDGYDACLLAIGAQKPLPLPFGNHNAPGVLMGVDFLREVALGNRPEIGNRVVVIGGGNVSMDVVRTCRRLGSSDVTLTCILLRKDMPAAIDEIEEADEEGVKMDNLAAPVRAVLDSNGRAKGLVCMRRPPCADPFDFSCNIPGTEYEIECDTIILAIGQTMDRAACEQDKIPMTRWIAADRATGVVKDDFVYAAGDCVTAPATVVEAVASAKIAAFNIDAKLRGVEIPPSPVEGYKHTRGTNDDFRKTIQDKKVPYLRHVERSARTPMPLLEAEERLQDFRQISGSFTEEQAVREANRCMQCGCPDAPKCELRQIAAQLGFSEFTACPTAEGRQEEKKEGRRNPFIIRDLDKCIGCLKCSRACSEIRYVDAIKPVRGVLPWNERDDSFRSGLAIDPTSCESCGTCLDICPVNALQAVRREVHPDKEIKTTCPYCGCGCGLTVGVKNGHVTGIRGDKGHPASHGMLCVKGRFGMNYVHDKQRLTTPHIRNAETGKLEPATWDEALDLVARRFAEIKEQHGPNALAGFSSAKVTNEENYCFMKFMRAVIGTNNVDHCARLCHASTVAGLARAFGSGAMTNSIDELEHADCILVTGSNTTETHPIISLKIKRAVRMHGAKLIVVDPRAINLTHFATMHIRQTSGTDVAFYNAMMSVIIREGLHKESFIRDFCENYEEFEEEVLKWTPERAAEICGVNADDIVRAARIYATAKNGSIIFSMGITQHSHGTDNVLSLANMCMLCGHIGRPSTGVNPLRGQNNVQGACDLGALPNVYSGYQAVTNPAFAEKFGQAWGRPMSTELGLPVTEAINAAYDGRVKGIYIMGENPAVSDPNLAHAKDALRKLDFLVVQDIFMTPTTEFAHVVLPAGSFIEKEGTFTNTERRVMRVRKCIDMPGEAREDWDITCDLARRMGYDMGFTSSFDIMEEIRRLTPSYAGMQWSRLEATGGLQWPCPSEEHPGTMYLHKDGKFARGKGHFYALPYRPTDEVPDEEYPLVLSTGRLLYHFHTGTMSRKTDGLNDIAPTTHAEFHANDAKRLGVHDGERIAVVTRRGRIEVTATVPSRVKEGMIFMPFHYEEAPANALTNDALDPIAKIPEFKACACRIEKL